MAAAIGLQSIGAVLVPLNTRLRGREVGDVLHRTRARLLVSAGRFLNTYYPAMLDGLDLPALQRVVVVGACEGDDPRQIGWPDFLALGQDVPAASVSARIAAVETG